jgi:predicted naringenin-chalcone synthase
MSYITAIGTANPSNRFSQTDLARFMTKAMQLSPADSRKLNTVFRASGIEHRHTVLEDYGKESNFTFFPNTPDVEPFPSTEARLAIFKKHALPLSIQAVQRMTASLPSFDKKTITHLVVVCCTGMYAPGLDIELITQLDLPTTIQRTCITFMGCYAAFNALKVADAFCSQDENTKVLVVCTELCSLHFQKEATEDNMLANALFSDGSAAVLVEAQTTVARRLKFEAFHNDLATAGAEDMAWRIGNLGFEMKLSTYVPDIIETGIRDLTQKLLNKVSLQMEDIAFFAMHPGGKKILSTIEDSLSIEKERNKAAYEVLKNYGNMSSPTVIFVLAEIFNTVQSQDDQARILSFAFGPGLTMESMLLRIETK